MVSRILSGPGRASDFKLPFSPLSAGDVRICNPEGLSGNQIRTLYAGNPTYRPMGIVLWVLSAIPRFFSS